MLRVRALLAAVVVAAAFIGLVAAGDDPTKVYTPANGVVGEGMCSLTGIDFYPAVQITPAFSKKWYTYTMECAGQIPGNQFYIKPYLYDISSSAEVTWNNDRINFRSPENTGISTTGKTSGSPKKQSFMMPWKKDDNTLLVGVGCNGLGQPYPCYYTYTFKCTISSNPGGVTGDPQFVGLRGQSFQVHGVAGEIYNIVSDSELQYNSRFVFLTAGACPVVDGVKQKACWSHPGSFLGELGLKTREGDKIHLVSGSADAGFTSVAVNGKELSVGSTLLLAGDMGSVSRNSTHLAHVLVGNWDFAFENSDMFVNQRVRVLDARKLASHGLLGQTWRTATYSNAVKYIQGAVDDYVIRDKDIYGDAFLYNQFD